MTATRALVVVALVALVSSCSKQKNESATPPADQDFAAESPGDAMASPEGGDTLASLEAELAARKAELGARGLSFDDDGSGGTTTPPTTPVDRETTAVVTPNEPAPKSSPPDDKPKTRRLVKQSKRKGKRTKANKDLAAKKSADEAPDACAPICGPADAICDLSARICGLADEHEEEERYANACERAEKDCARAAEACEECRD